MSAAVSANVDQLLEAIARLPGAKIVTLISADGRPFAIDVDTNGAVGYEPSHALMFRAKLTAALHDSGGLIVRQFTPFKTEADTPNGRRMLPLKNVYGVLLGGGWWTPVPRDQVEQACKTDSETGQALEPDPSVRYRDFPIGR